LLIPINLTCQPVNSIRLAESLTVIPVN